MTTPNLSPEYFDILKKEYNYVSHVLSYSTQKFPFLVNQGSNVNLLQRSIDELALRKTTLEIQLLALKEYLEE
jgi:hypothetical protein